MLKIIGYFGDATVATEADPAVEPGHQVILLSLRFGEDLARVLAGGPIWMTRQADGGEWIAVRHTAEVDERLLRLIDLLVEIRLSASGLVQLGLTGLDEEP